MEILRYYWDATVTLIIQYWGIGVSTVDGISTEVLLGLYAPGLTLIGFLLGYALRSNVSRLRRKRARQRQW